MAMVSTVMVLVTSLCRVKTCRGLSVTQFQLESSEAWTITFTFCFSLLLQLSQKSIAATEVPNSAPHVFLSGALEQTLAGVKSRHLPWPAGHLFAYKKLGSSMFKWG